MRVDQNEGGTNFGESFSLILPRFVPNPLGRREGEDTTRLILRQIEEMCETVSQMDAELAKLNAEISLQSVNKCVRLEMKLRSMYSF